MKIKLLFFAVFTSLLTFAKIDSTTYWNNVARVFHGTTNQVKGISADTNGNVYYSGYGYEINPGSRHALIAGKMNDTLGYVWKKHFYGFPTNAGSHQILSNDSSVYIVGEFINSIEFPQDTFTTASSTNAERFFVCLNANNGDVRWVRHLGRKEGTILQFDGNEDVVLSYSSIKGEQFYDGVLLDTVNNPNTTVRGYAYLTLDKVSGNLKNHCFGEYNMLGDQTKNQLVGRNVYSLMLTTSPPPSFITELNVRVLDLNTNTINYTTVKTNIGSYNIINTLYHPIDKSWTIFVKHPNNNILIGNDTVKKSVIANIFYFTSAIKLDSTLKVGNYISFPTAFGVDYQKLVNDTTLLFSFGTDGDGYVVKNGNITDTIHVNGSVSTSHRGYFIARCNINFENLIYNRFSVNNSGGGWQTGMALKGIDIDNKGNVYGAAFHENNIVALPDTVPAYNKSWAHLSVIAKYGNDSISTAPVSVNDVVSNNKIAVYPNPVSNILNIDSEEMLMNVSIFDLTGKAVALKGSSQIDVSGLKSGIYFIRIETQKQTQIIKFVKQ